jgi:hypothetical protein
MTSLASQQRLNKLSFAGANRSSRGVRIDAQDKERGEEFKERGGLMGQFGRLGQRMFGGAEAQKKLDMQQKASDARVNKQVLHLLVGIILHLMVSIMPILLQLIKHV